MELSETITPTLRRRVNWTPEPASERQLTYLRRLGHASEQPLSRPEAAELIRQYQDQHAAQLQQRAPAPPESEPQNLRARVGEARQVAALAGSNDRAGAQHALAQAVSEREEFWVNTCREVAQMRSASPQVVELSRQYGCRFAVPSHKQVEAVLAALDGAMPLWDRDHPELFYQTLELNFPELARRV